MRGLSKAITLTILLRTLEVVALLLGIILTLMQLSKG
jgi:hypothetical protein